MCHRTNDASSPSPATELKRVRLTFLCSTTVDRNDFDEDEKKDTRKLEHKVAFGGGSRSIFDLPSPFLLFFHFLELH